MFFSATVVRVVTPYREVTWADFLLADVLTSLSKPLADMERAACHLLTGPTMDPSERVSIGIVPVQRSARWNRWSQTAAHALRSVAMPKSRILVQDLTQTCTAEAMWCSHTGCTVDDPSRSLAALSA